METRPLTRTEIKAILKQAPHPRTSPATRRYLCWGLTAVIPAERGY
jgi:hypothetical protein